MGTSERLRLSIDVFVKEFSSDIAFTKLSSERNAVIDRFAVYDDDTFLLSDSCLYLCLDERFPPCKRIQEGTGIICTSAPCACANRDCNRCNLIALNNLSGNAVVNKVAGIISRYQQLGHDIEMAALSDDGLQQIMDVGEEMIGAPLCLMDANQNVIARSAHKALFGNPLWETIVRENKPVRCEIVDACVPEKPPDDPSLRNAAIYATSVSNYSLLTRQLFRRSRSCASLWALATEPNRVFAPGEFKLFAWIGRCLDSWAENTQIIQPQRGIKTERFLLDLVDGTLSDTTAIEAAARKVGFTLSAKSEYQLCAMRPTSALSKIESNLDMMQEVESCAPRTICAMESHTILALFTLEGTCELPKRQTQFLQSLCERRGYNAVMSTAYFNLEDTPRVLRQIEGCFSFVEFDKDRGSLHFLCDHLVYQIMRFVMSEVPPEMLLHPMVRKIQEYDQANGTNLLETLKIYLNNRCNAAETSSQLHMHRNTLLHRIKRIEEIIGQPFDDWTLRRILLLSIDYLYIEEEKSI